MNNAVVLLTRSEDLIVDLKTHVDNRHEIIAIDSLSVLASELETSHAKKVVVHLCDEILGDQSPSRFVTELNEKVENASIIGLIDADCSERLQALGDKTSDNCLEMPVDYDKLNELLAADSDPAEELAGFWLGLPHKELHGHSRSLVTFTPEMFETMEEVKVAAKHNVTVLLIGETGSGKTYLARLIHELSDRRDDRLVTVACGALPPDLIESELFGYVKGAFTGADRDKEGKFAAAGSGTLLLDEIDVLSLDQQAKLLRVIETGEYEPVGSNDVQSAGARLVVASNYNLEDLVHAGTFRTDLYYRLNILKFHLLPLRQRPWDIEYLARKFALEHSRTHSIPLREVDPSFLDALRRYHWPGNIREMENVIRRAVLYCKRGHLTVTDLPSSIRDAATSGTWMPPEQQIEQAGVPAVAAMGGMPPAREMPPGNRGAYEYAAVQPMTGNQIGSGSPGTDINMPAAAGSAPDVANGQPTTLEARVDMLERRIIEDCLRRNNHRRKETAAELGISRVTLYNKMKKFGLMG